MQRLTYRPATAADLPFIVEIIAADAVTAPIDGWNEKSAAHYEATLAAIDADPNHELFVVEHEGATIGTFQLAYLPGITRSGIWRGLVESVHIVPGQRNKGFGSEMMRWAIARCRTRGCGAVQLSSNKLRTDAHRFYEGLGFSRSHEGFQLAL